MNLEWIETDDGEKLLAKIKGEVIGSAEVTYLYGFTKMIAEVNEAVVDGYALQSLPQKKEIESRLTRELNNRGYR